MKNPDNAFILRFDYIIVSFCSPYSIVYSNTFVLLIVYHMFCCWFFNNAHFYLDDFLLICAMFLINDFLCWLFFILQYTGFLFCVAAVMYIDLYLLLWPFFIYCNRIWIKSNFTGCVCCLAFGYRCACSMLSDQLFYERSDCRLLLWFPSASIF